MQPSPWNDTQQENSQKAGKRVPINANQLNLTRILLQEVKNCLRPKIS